MCGLPGAACAAPDYCTGGHGYRNKNEMFDQIDTEKRGYLTLEQIQAAAR